MYINYGFDKILFQNVVKVKHKNDTQIMSIKH